MPERQIRSDHDTIFATLESIERRRTEDRGSERHAAKKTPSPPSVGIDILPKRKAHVDYGKTVDELIYTIITDDQAGANDEQKAEGRVCSGYPRP